MVKFLHQSFSLRYSLCVLFSFLGQPASMLVWFVPIVQPSPLFWSPLSVWTDPTTGSYSTYAPAADPGPSSLCPDDMRLVSTRHFDDVEHQCEDFRPKIHRCYAYTPDLTVANGEQKQMNFCMDVYEAPNRRGARPIVMKTFDEAQAWCEKHNKRLCSEYEWESACESGGELPWFYGWTVDQKVCNSSKPWMAFDNQKLAAGGETASKEAARLWQGSPSGDFANCRTKDGVYDMMGNVEEWVSSSRKRKFKGALMGGFWAKPWTGCRGTNDAHEPNFRFYEVGFRCCADAKSK